MDEEYELLSHEEIERLKKEADKYKNNPFIKNGSEEKLYSSIIEMTKSINRLTAVFEDVKQQILLEQEHGEGPDSKLDKILDQNKHLAHALVNFGEKIEEMTLPEQKDEEQEQETPQQTEMTPEHDAGLNQNNELNNDFSNFNNYTPNSNNPNNEFNINTKVDDQKKPETNFNNQPAFSQNTQQQQNTSDIDYQAWNYSKPTKPGVSQSRQDTSFAQQNSFQSQQSQQQQPFQQQSQQVQPQNSFQSRQPQQQQPFQQQSQQVQPQFQQQQPQQNFNAMNQPNNFSGGFTSPNQELEFPQGGFNPNYPQPEFSPDAQQYNESIPDLKQVPERPPEKKKRSFGLF